MLIFGEALGEVPRAQALLSNTADETSQHGSDTDGSHVAAPCFALAGSAILLGRRRCRKSFQFQNKGVETEVLQSGLGVNVFCWPGEF